METRVDPLKLSKTIKLLGFDDMCYSDCRGFTGGILIAWKCNEVAVKIEAKDFQFIHLTIAFHNEASCWLVAGDFNDIAFPEEKKGGAVVSIQKCNIFLDNINA
ncbi:hypothetical protein A2U01_0052105, partial [Trifolium medium]|nr:hypothetical protein [Trifolium medium]